MLKTKLIYIPFDRELRVFRLTFASSGTGNRSNLKLNADSLSNDSTVTGGHSSSILENKCLG